MQKIKRPLGQQNFLGYLANLEAYAVTLGCGPSVEDKVDRLPSSNLGSDLVPLRTPMSLHPFSV